MEEDGKTRVVINTLIKKLNKKETPYRIKLQGGMYKEKQENINKLRNTLDTLFLDHGCGILHNNEIIINKEYIVENITEKINDTSKKYVGSGLSILEVKHLVCSGDYIYKCYKCNLNLDYFEIDGRKSFNFKVNKDLFIKTEGLCNECARKRQLKHRNKNNINKLSSSIRSRTGIAFKHMGYNKNTKTQKMLGAEWEFVKAHIENRFTEDMSWSNYGKWHIDHIIPLCAANTEEELKLLCHHKNLQPLWAFDNISKNGKYNEKEKAEMLKFIINCK